MFAIETKQCLSSCLCGWSRFCFLLVGSLLHINCSHITILSWQEVKHVLSRYWTLPCLSLVMDYVCGLHGQNLKAGDLKGDESAFLGAPGLLLCFIKIIWFCGFIRPWSPTSSGAESQHLQVQKTMYCSIQVGSERVQVSDLFMTEGKMKHEVNMGTSSALMAVMALYHIVVVKVNLPVSLNSNPQLWSEAFASFSANPNLIVSYRKLELCLFYICM